MEILNSDMKVYILKPDPKFRFMYPEDSIYMSENWEFKCEILIEKLGQFKAHFDDRNEAPIPDIAYLGMLTFAFRHDVATELVDILEASAELLPFYVGEELWYCLNVTKSIDALDEELTTFRVNDGKRKLFPVNYVFHEDKLPNTSLFKIPTDNFTNVFCVDRRDTDDQVMNNFFCAVAHYGYTGIEFEEVFES